MTTPERDLTELLRTLRVYEHAGLWVYDTTDEAPQLEGSIFCFREREGWSQIRPATSRDDATQLWVWLELAVYSDLHAIGFLAHVSAALTAAQIPCNVIAAYHHDHLFVPASNRERALDVLRALSATP